MTEAKISSWKLKKEKRKIKLITERTSKKRGKPEETSQEVHKQRLT